ncbi:ornithine cyclodeaminase family protein [Xylophilus sp. GOD-11R]|uniref:ornithine cyclodeaminase family protein n=1 Tax=Xylophilus sp. GOD-11R TaxID=3089814 RepID=UPI00298BEB28|nr:ornithine cyclodeaminase family protein [Xylophilus sp. GOD-11R]WPB55200.1 ornithine cyclodeaminase family protein [Xylophilus sp. GOD-11R]
MTMSAPQTLRVIDGPATAAALPFGPLIAALRQAFATPVEVPLRHHHYIEQPDGKTACVLLMPGWGGGFIGIKLVTVFPGNSARQLPGLFATYLLCDGNTGEHLALIDGNQITARRTVAVSALAGTYLARPDAKRLLILGAGRIAQLVCEAYRAVRGIEQVRVWNPTPARAQALVAQLRAAGVDAALAGPLEAEIRQADIVSCATLSTQALVQGAWLRPGTHVDLIGAFSPGMRETDDAVFAGATVAVDSMDAVKEAGDLISPIAAGVLATHRIVTLPMLCDGRAPGRTSAGEITVFKAVGTALSDLTSAALVYRAVTAPAPAPLAADALA